MEQKNSDIYCFIMELDRLVTNGANVVCLQDFSSYLLNRKLNLWNDYLKEMYGDKIVRGAKDRIYLLYGYAVEEFVNKTIITLPHASKVRYSLQAFRPYTRPDIVLYEEGPGDQSRDIAWLDITSETSKNHVLRKRGSWSNIPFTAELLYPRLDIHKLEAINCMAIRQNPNILATLNTAGSYRRHFVHGVRMFDMEDRLCLNYVVEKIDAIAAEYKRTHRTNNKSGRIVVSKKNCRRPCDSSIRLDISNREIHDMFVRHFECSFDGIPLMQAIRGILCMYLQASCYKRNCDFVKGMLNKIQNSPRNLSAAKHFVLRSIEMTQYE
ncbi:MAG: hypothetical protein J1F18_03265 [Lachnospiraceae bacterium]|nr:hypothetical protein [Lachnospiraceae bacterium]